MSELDDGHAVLLEQRTRIGTIQGIEIEACGILTNEWRRESERERRGVDCMLT